MTHAARSLLAAAAVAAVLATINVAVALAAAKGKPNATAPVRLIVELTGAGTPDAGGIRSDGSAYTDGEAGVVAHIDQYGNLIISLGPIRSFCYDYSSPVEVTAGIPFSACPGNTYMATSGLGGGQTKKFQELDVDEWQCIRGEPTYTQDPKSTIFRHLFQRSVNGIAAEETGSSFLLATRIDNGSGPRVWTVESVNDCNVSLNIPGESGVARVVSYPQLGKYVLTDWGRFLMPMTLTLTEIPD